MYSPLLWVPLTDLSSLSQVAASDDSDTCDITLTSPATVTTPNSGSPTEGDCAGGCPCCCHRPSRDVQLIPKTLRPWLGRLNVPPTLLAAFNSSFIPCDHPECALGRQQIQKIKYTAPGWFAHVEATIRFEAVPVHFCIQTPRVVPTLNYLYWIDFDDFRIKLSNRDLTLYDVEPNGFSVLHVGLWHSHRALSLAS